MNMARPSQALLIIGGLAALTPLLLSWLMIASGVYLGLPIDALVAFLFYLTGAFAVWQRPNHLAARRLLLVGTVLLSGLVIGRTVSLLAIWYGPIAWFWLGSSLALAADLTFMSGLLGLFAVFPDGLYHYPYERWIVWAGWAPAPLVPVLLLLTRPTIFFNDYEVWPGPNVTSASPLYVSALAWAGTLAGNLVGLVPILCIVITIILLALRYRRFEREQRLQITWPLLAAAGFGLAWIPTLLAEVDLVPRSTAIAWFDLTLVFLPISIAIGLLRHRLFDIEVVLRKSLVYGVLWLMITLGYVGLAASLGIAAGGRLPLDLTILCTIIATLLFQPARRRLERLADRWVFGERLSGYELLTRFGETLESTFGLDDLIPRVVTMIRQGLDVRWVRVLLQRSVGGESILEPVGADGIELVAPARPVMTAPLLHGGEQIGLIECGPKREGQFEVKDHELLATLGRQTALAIRNAWLAAELTARLAEIRHQAAELAASRTRIVQAGDEERRRIERNLHDGVQQELVALLAKIRLARNQLARDPELGARTLAELQEEARQALEDLRELARGIHPPVLSDRGLLEAIEARLARLPLDVTLDLSGVGRGTRFATEIEGAAYFFVCEGLANVLKHAAAQQVTVRLAVADHTLSLEVGDDGYGFELDKVSLSGLRGLQDRIEALGGNLRLASRPSSGTTLAASLPI